MILYFSGTGNSKYVAQRMAEALNQSLLSMNDRIRSHDTSPAAHKGGKASAAALRRGKHALPAGKKRAFPASGEAFLPAACTLAAQTGKLGIRTLPAALAGRLAAQGADQPAWRDAAGDAPDVFRIGTC